MMLGVRQAGVTTTVGALSKAGFIRYERGRIQITDWLGLDSR
jgi:Mn-dependent DtxR family transcriptional regulator